jgi:hypothetical protein
VRSLLLLVLIGCSASAERSGSGPLPDSGPGEDAALDTAPPSAPMDDGILADSVTDDRDGDGFAIGADCDDGNPLINPGAIEVPGDGVDNNCNGAIDEALPSCDKDLKLDSPEAMDFARALGLCEVAKDRAWGVVSARITSTDGAAVPLPRQYGLQKSFGEAIKPRDGETMVLLSSGVARTPDQPGYVPLPKGTDSSANVSTAPEGWPRNVKGCPKSSKPYAFDSVVLELKIRTPTNAKAFSFDFDFFSSEYVEYVCQPYNDSFVALLTSKAKLDPSWAGNIAFDAAGDPINVNSGFFQACLPDSWLGRKFDCPLGVSELKGTGFDAVPSSLTAPARNGATSWLRTTQPIVGGEEITVRFAIWNTGDHWLPSSVLLDRFQWLADPTIGTKTERPK